MTCGPYSPIAKVQATEGGGPWERHWKKFNKMWQNACVGKRLAGMTRGWRGACTVQQVVDGMYRLDAGALLDDLLPFLEDVGDGIAGRRAWHDDPTSDDPRRAI